MIAILLIALVTVASAERNDLPEDTCIDTFFEVHVHPERCVNFYVCMISRIIQFECDDGEIFVEEVSKCVAGNRETCEVAEAVPLDLTV
ncbi:unnamed protein product [Diamesa serratosioi]